MRWAHGGLRGEGAYAAGRGKRSIKRLGHVGAGVCVRFGLAQGVVGMSAALLGELVRSRRVPWCRALDVLGNAKALDEAMAAWSELALPVCRDGDELVWSPSGEVLSSSAIGDGLAAAGEECEVAVEVLLDSTNARLLHASTLGMTVPRALLAECQGEGRGRRQRVWRARFGEAILLSVLVECPRPLAELPGLAIVAGVALTRALAGMQVSGLGLKWPNDVLLRGAKLAGVLVESGGRKGQVVIGIGINWTGAGRLSASLDRSVADLAAALPAGVDRNQVAVEVIAAILHDVRTFAEHGLRAFLDDFARYDALAGRAVRVLTPDSTSRFGAACGLAGDGGLKVDHGGTVMVYHSAEVSVVPA